MVPKCFKWSVTGSIYLLQKPYRCQVPGCTKKYTDPSSLRKHVKNHAVKDQLQSKKKSRESTLSAPTSLNNFAKTEETPTCLSIYNNFATQNVEEPLSPEDNTYIFDEMFEQIKEECLPVHVDDDTANSTLDLLEMSKCIVTIQDDNTFSYNFEPENDSQSFANDSIETNLEHSDEYVSIECIKKLLGEQNMDYIGSALQSHLNEEYFNQIH